MVYNIIYQLTLHLPLNLILKIDKKRKGGRGSFRLSYLITKSENQYIYGFVLLDKCLLSKNMTYIY